MCGLDPNEFWNEPTPVVMRTADDRDRFTSTVPEGKVGTAVTHCLVVRRKCVLIVAVSIIDTN
jgi:hypothetical protein